MIPTKLLEIWSRMLFADPGSMIRFFPSRIPGSKSIGSRIRNRKLGNKEVGALYLLTCAMLPVFWCNFGFWVDIVIVL
jgi:hypothetical protein